MRFGTPNSPTAIKVMLLGAGELGKEVAIELQRLGVEVPFHSDRFAIGLGVFRFHSVDRLDRLLDGVVALTAAVMHSLERRAGHLTFFGSTIILDRQIFVIDDAMEPGCGEAIEDLLSSRCVGSRKLHAAIGLAGGTFDSCPVQHFGDSFFTLTATDVRLLQFDLDFCECRTSKRNNTTGGEQGGFEGVHHQFPSEVVGSQAGVVERRISGGQSVPFSVTNGDIGCQTEGHAVQS